MGRGGKGYAERVWGRPDLLASLTGGGCSFHRPGSLRAYLLVLLCLLRDRIGCPSGDTPAPAVSIYPSSGEPDCPPPSPCPAPQSVSRMPPVTPQPVPQGPRPAGASPRRRGGTARR